jgi:tryptophan-rich sensory protein
VITLRIGTAAIALATCVVAAAVEGVAAGSSFRQRLAQLRLPRFSPALPVWVLIGVAYYIIAGTVLYRVLGLPPSGRRLAAVWLLLAILGINAIWNYFFFRRRSLGSSFLLGLLYSLLALVLCITLFGLDSVAGLVFLPYVVYLLYANIWTYGVWRLNARGTG